jgi:hypothetical protein
MPIAYNGLTEDLKIQIFGMKMRTEGGALVEGDLVYISGWSETYQRFLVTKADADAANSRATFICRQAIANNSNSEVWLTHRLKLQNTNGSTVGNPVYLSTTAGGWTLTAPNPTSAIQQVVGRVAVVSATVGEIEFDLQYAGATSIGSPDIPAGSITPSDLGIAVRNESGGSLVAGDLVYISGWNETQALPLVSKADANAAGKKAQFVIQATLTNNTNGQAFRYFRTAADQNTNGAVVGDPVYLSETAGGFTLSAPAAVTSISQIVGRVAVVSATVGVIVYDLEGNNSVISTSRNELAADAVDGTKIEDLAVNTEHLAANGVTAAKVTATMRTGFLQLPLVLAREVVSNDYGVNGTTPAGGILTKDTTPILERVNGATDKATRLRWAAANVDAVMWQLVSPPDLDDTADVTVKFLAGMAGAADTPTLGVAFFEGVGDTDAGGATGALAAAVATVSRTIAAADIAAAPQTWSIEVTPGAHGTDALYIYAAWVEYTRK